MAKKVVGLIKLQGAGGQGESLAAHRPALASAVSTSWNSARRSMRQTQKLEPGLPIPVVITAYADKSFTFIMKTPPATVLIKKARKIDKGSPRPAYRQGRPYHARAGRGDRQDQDARPDGCDLEAAVKTIAGSARSMGIEVEGCNGTTIRSVTRRCAAKSST
jgi:large subunit ribosomal protein L11